MTPVEVKRTPTDYLTKYLQKQVYDVMKNTLATAERMAEM